MMNHWILLLCDVFRQTYLDAVASKNLTENFLVGTGENHQNRPEIRCQRSRFYRVPGRGGQAASQMGSPDAFPLGKFHVRCLYLHFCELKPVC